RRRWLDARGPQRTRTRAGLVRLGPVAGDGGRRGGSVLAERGGRGAVVRRDLDRAQHRVRDAGGERLCDRGARVVLGRPPRRCLRAREPAGRARRLRSRLGEHAALGGSHHPRLDVLPAGLRRSWHLRPALERLQPGPQQLLAGGRAEQSAGRAVRPVKGTRAWTARQVEGVPTAEATGRWRAVWLDLETAREQDDVARVMTVVLTNLDRVLSIRQPDLPRPERTELDAMLAVPDTALLVYLGRLAALDPRPLVMLFDEADGLVGRAMVSFLTQLR